MYTSDEGVSPDEPGESTGAGGWSVTDSLFSGDTTRVVSLQADFKKVGPFTIRFSMRPLVDISAATVATLQAVAAIDFCVQGGTTRRLISITDGTSISGVAETVNVRCSDISKAEGGAIDIGKEYEISVLVGPGTRAASGTPPVLQQENIVFVVLAGANLNVPVPPGAGIKSLLVTVASIDGSVIPDNKARVTQTTPHATAIAMYDPRSYDWCPLASGARTVNLANLSAVSQLYAIFWGIDG